MSTQESFSPQGISKSTQALADCVPIGKIFDAKNIGTSNFRKFIKALAREQVRYEGSIFELINQYIPNFTISYIEEWERELGIPDECFNSSDFTEDERRRNIIIKLAFLTLVTPEDYLELAAILNISISLLPATDISRFDLQFPITFGNYFSLFIIIEDDEDNGFPYTFPFIFGTNTFGLFECLVRNYKQAYIEVVFIFDTNIDVSALLDGNNDVIVDGDGNAIFVPD